jgi:hypothetical protein
VGNASDRANATPFLIDYDGRSDLTREMAAGVAAGVPQHPSRDELEDALDQPLIPALPAAEGPSQSVYVEVDHLGVGPLVRDLVIGARARASGVVRCGRQFDGFGTTPIS